jgi:transcriptional regulator with XRE-family HTH domain
VPFEQAIRARRQQLGLTLQQLAGRSGVSAAMLSEVERGQKSPTLRVAAQIAEGLECAVSDLLDEQPTTRLVVQRRRERRGLVERESGIERHLLAPPLLAHGIEVVWYIVPRGRASGLLPPQRQGVLVHATIVTGALESIAGTERVVLRAGDSLNYAGDMQHEFRNAGRGTCEFFLVVDASHVARSSGPAGDPGARAGGAEAYRAITPVIAGT